MSQQATAIAHPNIAFIKYWGNADDALRLPANPSLSMNLAALHTITTVTFEDDLAEDVLVINEQPQSGSAVGRVRGILDLVRNKADVSTKARVMSETNFPVGAGIASSASAFSALAVASSHAAGLELDEAAMSRLARRGSGSASRSVPTGFCEWVMGDDISSVAHTVAPPEHWDLQDLVVVVSQGHKAVGSTGGHPLAKTSSLQKARVAGAPDRLRQCREALLARDFATFGPIIEEDAVIMHGIMMTSHPPLYYWTGATMEIIQATQRWQKEGLPVYFTIDAGPNVHLICEPEHAETAKSLALQLPGVQAVLQSGPGGPARLIDKP